MADDHKKPLGFSFSRKHATASAMLFVVTVIVALVVIGGAYVYGEYREWKSRPSLALKSFSRDIKEYKQMENRYPASIRELSEKIWIKRPGGSRIGDSESTVAFDGYEYIYFGKDNECGIWAIPLGNQRHNYETVYLYMTGAGEQVWRGGALNEKQRDAVVTMLSKRTPTYSEMSSMNMKKDGAETPPSKAKGPFSFF